MDFSQSQLSISISQTKQAYQTYGSKSYRTICIKNKASLYHADELWWVEPGWTADAHQSSITPLPQLDGEKYKKNTVKTCGSS